MAANQKTAKGKTGKSGASKAAETRAYNQIQERRKRESIGVLLIAAGILLGAYLIFSATGFLGKVLSTALFGLIGSASYVLPLVLIGMGILSIRGDKYESARGAGWFVMLGMIALITLIQLTKKIPFDGPYMEYLNDAYNLGSLAHRGGGFVGATLCYPLQKLGGNVLAYTLLIAIIVIAIVAVSNLSIRDVSAMVGESVRAGKESTHEQLFDDEPYAEDALPSGRKLFTIDLDADDVGGAKKTGKKRPAPAAAKSASPAKKAAGRRKKAQADDDDGLSFMPLEGGLRTKDGGVPKPKKPQQIVTDIWDEVEPVTDVPLIIKPEKKGGRKKAEAPLPDTEALFGAQKKEKPVRKVQPNAEAVVYSNAPAYEPPPFSLLQEAGVNTAKSESPNEKARLLVETLASFNITARVVNVSVGPVLTRFELQPAPGVRVSRITSLSNDIALALAAQRVRIEAPIPGKAAVGIEIPNKNSVTVVLRDIVESREFAASKSPITMALGKDVSGKIVVADLAKMPHMLIAGATGSGKSVCINDIIISMVYKSSPAELRMVLIDPKMVELSTFAVLPHLLIPVVTEPKKAASALRWAVNEMTMRYKRFSEQGARDIARFNELQDAPENRLPKIVVIIDELADLMMVAPDEVEDAICRIAQLGRAAGIHLIVATQRPSADVITGLIKANIPSRCAFAVSSGIDSRIILDSTGAEKLLGRGDMLFHPNGAGKPTRLQCAFVADAEVERFVSYFKSKNESPNYDEQVVADMKSVGKSGPNGGVFGEGKQEDELLGEGVRIVLESGQASISMIQRRLRVGYARAARLIDIMEQHGYVSGFDGSKPRKVLIKREQYEELFGDGLPLADGETEA